MKNKVITSHEIFFKSLMENSFKLKCKHVECLMEAAHTHTPKSTSINLYYKMQSFHFLTQFHRYWIRVISRLLSLLPSLSVLVGWKFSINFFLSLFLGLCHCQKREQEDPCKTKSRVVGDATYCDRYWECIDGEAVLYDCPNGLVFAGKNRGVTEGCDYPWRAPYCVGKQTASE